MSPTSTLGRCPVPKHGSPKSVPEGRAHFGPRPGPSHLSAGALLPPRGPSALTMAARPAVRPVSAASKRRVAPRTPRAAAMPPSEGCPAHCLPAARKSGRWSADSSQPPARPPRTAGPRRAGPGAARPRKAPGASLLTLLAAGGRGAPGPAGPRRPGRSQSPLCGRTASAQPGGRVSRRCGGDGRLTRRWA